MNILVIDAQGGGLGKQLIAALRKNFPDMDITAVGTILVLDVPIPVKHGFVDVCNQIWVVSTRDDIRLDRLVLRGMDREDAKKRMAMQMTREEYEELGDVILVNDGTIDELILQIEDAVKKELNERGIRL